MAKAPGRSPAKAGRGRPLIDPGPVPDPLPDLADLGHKLQATFPDLGPITPRRVLGAGFRSVAVATAEGHVFRIARNAAAAIGYAKEGRLLPLLRPYLPLPIPDPQWAAGPSESFPFGVIGYPLLPGHPLAPAHLTPGTLPRLAAEVAAFLRVLHRVPLAALASCDLPEPTSRAAQWAQMRDDTLPVVAAVLTTAEYTTLVRWWERLLADPIMHDYRPVPHHGDMWYENILVDDEASAVVGIVDFEDAALGDPAQDFATLLHLGTPFAAQVATAYRAGGGSVDATFDYRMQRLWELREWEGLHFAIRTADHAELTDALSKLRGGPILREGAVS